MEMVNNHNSPLGHALKDLVIYEVSVRGFTQDPSSGVENPGTYLGMVEKLDELKVMCLRYMYI